MDDILDTFLAAQRTFGERVNAVADDQWQLPTPDEDWSVADLVAHLVDEHRWAAPLLHGQDLDTAAKIVAGSRSMPVDGGVGANYAQEWEEAAVLSADAFSADGALDRTVALSYGDTPARDYAEEMVMDLVVHSWDLGKAIGFDAPLPGELVDAVAAKAASSADAYGDTVFGPPVEVADDASAQDKLVARTGRDPGWSASGATTA